MSQESEQEANWRAWVAKSIRTDVVLVKRTRRAPFVVAALLLAGCVLWFAVSLR
jgi:hypothetical protein